MCCFGFSVKSPRFGRSESRVSKQTARGKTCGHIGHLDNKTSPNHKFTALRVSVLSWGTAEVNPVLRKDDTAAGARSSPTRKLSEKADSYLQPQSVHRRRDDGFGGLGASKPAKTLCRWSFFVSSYRILSPALVSLYPDSSSQRGVERRRRRKRQ